MQFGSWKHFRKNIFPDVAENLQTRHDQPLGPPQLADLSKKDGEILFFLRDGCEFKSRVDST